MSTLTGTRLDFDVGGTLDTSRNNLSIFAKSETVVQEAAYHSRGTIVASKTLDMLQCAPKTEGLDLSRTHGSWVGTARSGVSNNLIQRLNGLMARLPFTVLKKRIPENYLLVKSATFLARERSSTDNAITKLPTLLFQKFLDYLCVAGWASF